MEFLCLVRNKRSNVQFLLCKDYKRLLFAMKNVFVIASDWKVLLPAVRLYNCAKNGSYASGENMIGHETLPARTTMQIQLDSVRLDINSSDLSWSCLIEFRYHFFLLSIKTCSTDDWTWKWQSTNVRCFITEISHTSYFSPNNNIW